MEGRAPLPPAAATLGMELIEADLEKGTIELGFTAREEWTNPAGNVLGAFVAAILYDTVGPALLATLEPDQFQATEKIEVHFLNPLRPGPVVARGRILERNGDEAVLDAELIDGAETTIATATATARVIPLAHAPHAV